MIITDIHSHILPGVDDGAVNEKMAMEMLKSAYHQGIYRMIATPHYRRGIFEIPLSTIQRRYIQVKKLAANIGGHGIELYLGCEYYRHSEMSDALKAGIRPTMAESRYVLVEFSALDPYSKIRSTIYELVAAGYIPIIAHAERYKVMLESTENVKDIIALGAMIQVNADSVIGKNGRKAKSFCKRLMKNDCIHFIASDTHDMKKRPINLRECADYIEKKWGKATAIRIFCTNPSKMIGQR